MQNTYFSGLARKKHFFKRSVLKYVSIKKMLLTPPDPKRRVCVNAPDGFTKNCRQGISKGRQEGREAGRANDDRTRQGVAGTAVLVKLQAAAAGHMWGPEEAKQGGESAAKHKAPCASSSKGLWSNR